MAVVERLVLRSDPRSLLGAGSCGSEKGWFMTALSPLDDTKIRIGTPALGQFPIYYDGVHMGDVVRIEYSYRSAVLIVGADMVSSKHCGDAQSLEAAAKLVVLAFMQHTRK
jgi:hypothetical protein